MASQFVLLPAAPVFVPELSGSAWAEVSTLVDVGRRLLGQAHESAPNGVLVIAHDTAPFEVPYVAHDLRRWGAPTVRVGGVTDPESTGVNHSDIPGSVLMAWWWIKNAGIKADVRTYVIDTDTSSSPHSAARRAIEKHDGIVVFMGDGPAALAPKAPIPLKNSAVRLDRQLTEFIDTHAPIPDLQIHQAESLGWYSHPVWSLLSESLNERLLVGASHAAPFGVGYHAARWETHLSEDSPTGSSVVAGNAAGNVGQEPTPIVVVGPTGTGKSDLALDLAEELGGEIVNLDAMQLYKGMDIGTAKVPPEERRGIPHHLFDVLEVTDTASVADYQRDARAVVESIRATGHVPIIVGGSMLYYQSLLDDWSFPETDPEVRKYFEQRLERIGVQALHAELARRDPEAASTILDSDPRRTVRALEVIELTGKPFSASRPKIGLPRWDSIILALDVDTEELDTRLERRTRAMFELGLIAEVRWLESVGIRDGVTARRAIGYSQILEMLNEAGDGEPTAEAKEDAEYRTYVGTRRYVRRQRSWFRRDNRITWLDANPHATESLLQQALRTVRDYS